MKHLGDITKINGAEVEPVWVIIGGSPCQDLSVAGKRAGLAGARSGLFMEQIRVIKEMRQHERDIGRANDMVRPRYMVWENVPGAFSSNKGEDFRAVLEETARIADGNADVPQPPNGKWSNAGCIMGNGWSIAWRVHDAQFWGVPQRRRRISLVADFGGQSAPEILFERKGVSGDIAESGTEGERIAADVERSTDTTECITPWDCQSKRIFNTEGKCPTLQGGVGGGVNNPAIFPAIVRTGRSVRRLTPLECERLQGYPDGWTDIGDWTDSKGKVHKQSDSARYKALGNSIALPPWRWVLLRITAQYERPATLGSLFDGIGGFPLIWERLNGDGTCLWTSEIEEFCIAVTKMRFGAGMSERSSA